MAIEKLLQFIKDKESYGGNYEILHGDKPNFDRLLTSKTINQVLEYQKQNKNKAAGAYQIVPKTLQELTKKMGLSGNELFDKKMQDKLAIQLFKNRGIDKVMAGKMTPQQFGNELAKEWSALPLVTNLKGKKAGRSYYEGLGGNKALVSKTEMPEYLNLLGTLAPKTKSTLAKAVESLIPSANAAEAPVEDDAETSLKLGASGEGLKFGASGEGLQYPQGKLPLTFEDFQNHMKRKVFEPEIPGDTVSPEWQGFMPDATVPTPPPSAGAGRGFVNPTFNQDEIRGDTVDPEWAGYMDALRAGRGNLFGGYPARITEPIQVIPNVRREYIPEVSIGAGAGRGFENPPSVMPDEVYRDNEIRPKSFMGEPVAPQNIWRDSEGNPILDRWGGYIYSGNY